MNYYGQIRSPETKNEVKQAAKVLIGLGAAFVLAALAGILMTLVSGEKEMLILTVVCGNVSLLLFAAGAYNIYYTRRMAHAPFVEKALSNPMITVSVIVAVIFVVIFGGIFLMIALR